jgi:hypothetical protein
MAEAETVMMLHDRRKTEFLLIVATEVKSWTPRQVAAFFGLPHPGPRRCNALGPR